MHIWDGYLQYSGRYGYLMMLVDDPLEFDCLEETRLVRLGRARRTVSGLLRRSVG